MLSHTSVGENVPQIICRFPCGVRRIVIVGGQPYFESTGTSTMHKGLWIPFIMAKGNLVPVTKTIITPPDHLNAGFFNQVFFTSDRRLSTLLIQANIISYKKRDLTFATADHTIKNNFQNRFITKEHLITSLRLSQNALSDHLRQKLKDSAGLTGIESAIADISIELAAPQHDITNPDEVNLWLLVNGAKDLNHLVTHNNNLGELVASFSVKRLRELPQLLKSQHIPHFLHPQFKDVLLIEARAALKELTDLAEEQTKLKIQNTKSILDVLLLIDKITKHLEIFIAETIGDKLNAEKTQAFVSFCAEKIEQIKGIKKLTSDPELDARYEKSCKP